MCGLYDLKPSVVAHEPAGQQPAPVLRRLRRRDQHVSGLRREPRCAVPQRRVPPGRHRRHLAPFDNCNLLAAGFEAVELGTAAARAPKSIRTARRPATGSTGFRPDAKMSGSYTLPSDIQLTGTYQFSRGVQNGGAGPSQSRDLDADQRGCRRPMIGRTAGPAWPRAHAADREGPDYGDHNLNQLDLAGEAVHRRTASGSASTSTSTTCSTATGRSRPTRSRPARRQRGCGRPTCCSTGSSRSAVSSTSKRAKVRS